MGESKRALFAVFITIPNYNFSGSLAEKVPASCYETQFYSHKGGFGSVSNSGHSLGSRLVDYVHDYGKTLQQNNMKGKGDDSTDHTPQSHTHTHTHTNSQYPWFEEDWAIKRTTRGVSRSSWYEYSLFGALSTHAELQAKEKKKSPPAWRCVFVCLSYAHYHDILGHEKKNRSVSVWVVYVCVCGAVGRLDVSINN